MKPYITELYRLATDLDYLSRRASEWDSAAVILVDDNGKGLILKRGPTAPWQPNVWNLPGGTRDPGENSSKEVAIRECQEELGVTPRNIEFYGVVRGTDYTLHLYVAHGYSGALHLNKAENTEMVWVAPEEAAQYKFVPKLREPIIKALLAFKS